MHRLLPAVFLAIFALAAQAAEKPGALPEPPPPVKDYQAQPVPSAKNADAGVLPEPEVTTTTHGDERREEFRMSGRLYMIKVTPKRGRPYYLVDKEGKGQFVKDDIQHDVSPPMWVIRF